PPPPRARDATVSPVPPPAPAPERIGDGLRLTMLGRTLAFEGAIDWSAPGPGPEHQLARMTLHYMQWTGRGDDALFAAAVESWIAAAGEPGPGAWRDAWNPYALSLRAVAWMDGMTARGVTPPVAEASLARQIRHLAATLETDIGGNHLVKNVRALIRAGAFFAGPEADGWRRLGLRHLAAVLAEQVPADGVHFERSPAYHAQVFADLLDCRVALGAATPAALDDALARMAQAIADLRHPDGGIALFNDAGLSMAEAPAACLDAYARITGSAPAPRPRFAFADAGYFGRRDPGGLLVVDCGRLAPDALPAHGHGDLLSFEWSVGGRRIVVDQGVYEYVAGPRRQMARSAASHNTLCLDGADQADFFGAFRFGRRPTPRLERFADVGDATLFAGGHDGFSHLPGRPRHARRIVAGPDRLEIVDRIEGRPRVGARIGFLLHPAVALTAETGGLRLAVGDVRIGLRITGGTVAVEPAPWWPDMGVEEATRRIRIRVEPGRAEVVSTFTVHEGGGAETT
ncbi:heparinase II/III family protein, partial [Oharaeibacter diazotrophicus]